MSAEMDVHVLNLPVGALTGSTSVPLAYFPTGGGGLSVLSAVLTGPGPGTAIGLLLVSMSDLGTPAVNGTVATFGGTVIPAAGVTFKAAVGTPYVAGGSFLGAVQTSGTIPANSTISVAYVIGK
jgi:hypothetical protein